MESIMLVGVSESPLNYNNSIDKAVVSKGLELGVRPELFVMNRDDVATIGFSILFRQGEEQLLSYNIRLTYRVTGFDKMASSMSDDEIKNSDIVRELLNETIGFARGSMYVRVQNTPASKFTLPFLSLEDIQKNLVVNRL